MKYINERDYVHGSEHRVGVLITNLGTPEAPNRSALRTYLKEFLSDPRVVEFPRWLWWLVLNLVILNIRPAASARSYQKVWTEDGSPLMVHTKNQAEKLKALLPDVAVEFAMRYGNPSIASGIQTLLDQGARKIVVLPLYPQYSGSTTASTFDALAHDFTRRRWLPDVRFISSYHDHPGYIAALANKIKLHQQEHGAAERLLFSFHGVPQRYLDNGDPYHCQCHKTARLTAEQLGLEETQYQVVFQSRFGREPWLQPYCDETLKQLPNDGVKSVQVVCPGFASDCLETLEEIAMENRGYFLEAGGERFEYIPALNDDAEHIQFLAGLINENSMDWQSQQNPKAAELASALGAKS